MTYSPEWGMFKPGSQLTPEYFLQDRPSGSWRCDESLMPVCPPTG